MIQEKNPDIKITTTDFDLRYNFPLPDNTYTKILCTETIEHIKDRDSKDISNISTFTYNGILNMLCECNRILTENGILFITTPNLNSYKSISKILNHENPYTFAPHNRELSVKELVNMTQKCGFQIQYETKNVWSEDKNFIEISNLLKNKFNIKDRGDNIFLIGVKKQPPNEILYHNDFFTIKHSDLKKTSNIIS